MQEGHTYTITQLKQHSGSNTVDGLTLLTEAKAFLTL